MIVSSPEERRLERRGQRRGRAHRHSIVPCVVHPARPDEMSLARQDSRVPHAHHTVCAPSRHPRCSRAQGWRPAPCERAHECRAVHHAPDTHQSPGASPPQPLRPTLPGLLHLPRAALAARSSATCTGTCYCCRPALGPCPYSPPSVTARVDVCYCVLTLALVRPGAPCLARWTRRA